MAKFNRIDAPYSFKEYYTKYPQGQTIFEALLNWLQHVNDMTDNINDLNMKWDEFIASFDAGVQEEVRQVIEELQTSGDLNIIISEVVQTEITQARVGEDNTTYSTLKARLDAEFKRKNDLLSVSILDFDAVSSTPDVDNAPFINAAIDYVYARGGGMVTIPAGVYYVDSTVILKPFVVLKGVNRSYRDGFSKGSVIRCTSATSLAPVTMIQASGLSLPDYCWSSGIKDLGVFGNNHTTALDLIACANTIIDNVNLSFHNIGLLLSGGMLDTYHDLTITHCVTYGMYVKNNRTTTTQRFYNLYLGQNHLNLGCIPLKVESYSCTDLQFYSPTFESNPNAVEIGSAVNVLIENIYVENMPSGNGTKASTDVFYVGKRESGDNPELYNYNAILRINGGVIIGSIAPYSTHNMFKVDHVGQLVMRDVWYRRFGKVVDKTVNFVAVPQFESCYGEPGLVTEDIDQTPIPVNIVNCFCGTRGRLSRSVSKIYSVALLNNWSNLGSGYEPFTVKLTEDGMVHISGTITGGNTNTVAQLPVDLRPKNGIIQGPTMVVVGGDWTPRICRVDNSGNLTVLNTNVGLSTQFHLSYSIT